MGILIGMDEAGYGPNLGPLVVAATAWDVAEESSGDDSAGSWRPPRPKDGQVVGEQVAPAVGRTVCAMAPQSGRCHSPTEVDLYHVLRKVVTRRASERRIAICDSKVLYSQSRGLRQLERGVHAVFHALGQRPARWSELVRYCDADPENHHLRHCWPDGFDCAVPVDAMSDEVAELGERFARTCEAAGVRPLVIRARFVFPEQFNELVVYYGTKGGALSQVTVGLLREVMETAHGRAALNWASSQVSGAPAGDAASGAPVPVLGRPLYAVCDKHGGRNFYAALLQHHFPEYWIEPVYESRAASCYRWGPAEAPQCVVFRMNGETFLPTALASMTAKYLRELAMRAFNEFWCARVPKLRPTAGYAGDSRRFKQAISTKQSELGIEDKVIWRER